MGAAATLGSGCGGTSTGVASGAAATRDSGLASGAAGFAWGAGTGAGIMVGGARVALFMLEVAAGFGPAESAFKDSLAGTHPLLPKGTALLTLPSLNVTCSLGR